MEKGSTMPVAKSPFFAYSIVVTVAFLLLAGGMASLAYMAIASDRLIADRGALVLSAVGGLAACIAMIIRWQRLEPFAARLQDPGGNLGILAKLVGCFAAGLLPAALYAGSAWAALLAFLALISIGLWLGYRHVVWAWYLIPTALFGYVAQGVLVALFVLFGSEPMTSYDTGRVTGTFVMAPLWLYLAIKLSREVRAWHRRVREEDTAGR
jgi:hypothetical protein